MNYILDRWMIDAEAFELQKLYRVNINCEYEFISRQGDFYITLLNRMYNILQETEHAEYEAKRKSWSKLQRLCLYIQNKRLKGISRI